MTPQTLAYLADRGDALAILEQLLSADYARLAAARLQQLSLLAEAR